MDGLFRLFEVVRHDDALACGQTIGLDHDRSARLAHEREGVGFAIAGAIPRGRKPMPDHEFLRERFAALEPGGVGIRAEDGDSRRADGVGDACDQRGLGADDHKPYPLVFGKAYDGLRIARIERHVPAALHRSPVSGGYE